ncbi:DUF3993 domain-containing protein [Bacillus alveayuensis]|uniref:DUF3993 domain-containing protein n=1 Tax=Aeribacillus alveayuensis TaxID=279215 RepID=UPI0005D0F173|nr:DUF3993 domain-containing protein [Bacillus alveayuensis]
MRTSLFAMIIMAVLFGQVPLNVAAIEEKELMKEETIGFLQDAFAAQVSLTEKERSLSEIMYILTPYFNYTFRQSFIHENVEKGKSGYFVYATDAPNNNVVPFFDYNKPFTFQLNETTRLIYQFFPKSSEGPVSYEDHYEAVYFKKKDGKWKIHQIQFSEQQPHIPHDELNNLEGQLPLQNEKGQNMHERQTIQKNNERKMANQSVNSVQNEKNKDGRYMQTEEKLKIPLIPFLPTYWTVKSYIFSQNYY